MEDFLTALRNPYTVVLVVITTVGTLIAIIFRDMFGWMGKRIWSGCGRSLRWVLLGLKRTFTWSTDGIREWHRVSAYRHRPLIWDDLPEDSKGKIGFNDLGTQARSAIRLSDLPEGEKYHLLRVVILPRLYDLQHEVNLSIHNDIGRETRNREIKLIVRDDDFSLEIHQTAMLLSLDVIFPSLELEIDWRANESIWFRAKGWEMGGIIVRHNQICPGRQRVAVYVNQFSFDRLVIFNER